MNIDVKAILGILYTVSRDKDIKFADAHRPPPSVAFHFHGVLVAYCSCQAHEFSLPECHLLSVY